MSVEILDQVQADRLPEETRRPWCTLAPHTYLRFRCLVQNVNVLSVAIDSAPHDQGEHYAYLDQQVPAKGSWTSVTIRLDDAESYRPFTRGMVLPLMEEGDPIWRIYFMAVRADTTRDEGCFYLDDVVLYEAP